MLPYYRRIKVARLFKSRIHERTARVRLPNSTETVGNRCKTLSVVSGC